MQVVGDVHQVGFLSFRDERHRCIVAQEEAAALDIERLCLRVVVQGGERLVGIELLDAEDVTLVAVGNVEGRGIERAVLEDGQHLVFRTEFPEVLSALLVVEFLDVGVEPDVLPADGGDALRLQLDLRYRVLGNQVAAGSLSLDRQGGEVVFELRFLEFRPRAQVDPDGLRLSVVVDGEPEDLRPGLAGGDVVVLVTRDGGDVEPLRIGVRPLPVAVDDVIDGAGVAAPEDAHVQEVLPEEHLVGDLRDAVLAVLGDDDDFRQVGAVADIDSLVVLLHADPDEAFFVVGVKLGVVADDLGHGDALEGGDLGMARERLAVLRL